MARTRGRRPGGMDTRSAIIAEARRQFGEAGYAPTTLRSVAAGAGVDPRLVLHYFGSKRGLFQEAVVCRSTHRWSSSAWHRSSCPCSTIPPRARC
jgi:AcrR family transcriptional regulator